MLQLFHGFKKSFLLILMVVIVAFVMTGFGIDLGGSNRTVAAIKINDHEVSFDQFYKYRQDMENRYRQMLGENFDTFAGSIKLNQQVVDRVISEKLINDFADKVGLIASRIGVQQMILTSGLFPNGYDEQRYRSYLQQVGMTSAQFEGELRNAALSEQFFNIVQDASVPSKREIESMMIRGQTKYDVDYLEFDPQFYLPSLSEPSEDEVKAYYEENSTDYEVAPNVSYHYLVLDPKDFVDQVEVLNEDIEFYYSERQNDFRIPEKVQLRRIQFNFSKDDTPEAMASLRARAEEVRGKALAGEEFSELAQIHSDDFATKTMGGDLGDVVKGQSNLPAEILTQAFALKRGEISDVIELDYGYEIIKVESVTEATIKGLDLVRDEIEAKLRMEQAPAYASAKAHDLYDAWSKSEKSLEQFALTQDLVARVTPEQMEAGEDPENLRGLTNRILSAATVPEQLIELGDITVLVGIKEYNPAEVAALANVKPAIVGAWKNREARKVAREAAQALHQAMVDGSYKSLEEAASTLKYKVNTVKDVNSGNMPPPLNDPQIQSEILRTSTPLKTPSQVYEHQGKFYITQVKSLTQPDAAENSSKIAESRMQEKDRMGQLVLASIVNSLKSQSSITIDPSLDLTQ